MLVSSVPRCLVRTVCCHKEACLQHIHVRFFFFFCGHLYACIMFRSDAREGEGGMKKLFCVPAQMGFLVGVN